jgi:hypothetical protein
MTVMHAICGIYFCGSSRVDKIKSTNFNWENLNKSDRLCDSRKVLG